MYMRAYTRAQRPSVALCLRPEISLACLANHGLDNNTVIDRTNLVLHRLLFFHVHLLLRDHHRLVQPTASSKRVTFHPSRLRERKRERESQGEKETKEERERSQPVLHPSDFFPSVLFADAFYLSSGSPCCDDLSVSLSFRNFLFPLFSFRRRERPRVSCSYPDDPVRLALERVRTPDAAFLCN